MDTEQHMHSAEASGQLRLDYISADRQEVEWTMLDETGLKRYRYRRGLWEQDEDGDWHVVPDITSEAALLEYLRQQTGDPWTRFAWDIALEAWQQGFAAAEARQAEMLWDEARPEPLWRL